MKAEALKIVLAGAGNLAWHLGPALQQAGYDIVQVYSRTEKSARRMGEGMGVPYTCDAEALSRDAAMVIMAIPDAAIGPFSENLPAGFPCLVHTSGSVPASVLEGKTSHYGVFYPLMTFTAGRPLDFSTVPVCIEAGSSPMEKVLRKMALSLSCKAYTLTFEKRRKLHLAAVIATNFSNHMYHLAGDYLESEGLDFGILKPVIRETAEKVMTLSPGKAQTGPARRCEAPIIDAHIALLAGNPELQKLYTFVSNSIQKRFSGK